MVDDEVSLTDGEESLRTKFAKKLEGYGWIALEEVWVKKGGKTYRADLIARHEEYAVLGWFLFELKRYEGSFADSVTKAHKQIVYRYIGATIDEFRHLSLKETPKVYVYRLPFKERDVRRSYQGSWFAIIRFFNRYGIGLLFEDSDEIIFHPNAPNWSRLHLDPERNEKWLDLSRLKSYLETRVTGLH